MVKKHKHEWRQMWVEGQDPCPRGYYCIHCLEEVKTEAEITAAINE